MQTFKTSLVVVALLGGLFVAYQALNGRPLGLPFDLARQPSSAGEGEEVTLDVPPLSELGPPQALADATSQGSSFPNSADASGTAPPPALAADAPMTEFTPSSPVGDRRSPFARQAAHSQPLAPETPFAAPSQPGEQSSAESSAAPPAAAVDLAGAASATQPFPTDRAAPAESNSSPAASDEAERSSAAAAAKYSFEQAWQKAELQIADGQLARALLTLSAFYRRPDLEETLHAKLHERLDQLAGTVIYSTRHLLEAPHKSQSGESLEQIAARCHVSARLLQNINGLQDASLVLPGTELKLVRGPFRGEVDLARQELTMFLGGMYAGRFSLRVGQDPAPKPGQYEVLDIQPGHAYYATTGQMIAAGQPSNPYGAWWIDLGHDLSIHGSPERGDVGAGCLSLASRDAADVAAILSPGSKVTIK